MADPIPGIRDVVSSIRLQAHDLLSDGELLSCYATTRDEDAFRSLVDRHAVMVERVCRQVTARSADWEDAVQATFWALARRPEAIRSSVAGWLYRTAFRIAWKSRRRCRRTVGSLEGDPVDPRSVDAEYLLDDRATNLLPQELAKLPDRWQAPLTLCYLVGLTRDAAAVRLGLSLRTLHRRLEEGRDALRIRLERQGVFGASIAAVFVVASTAGASAKRMRREIEAMSRADYRPSRSIEHLSRTRFGYEGIMRLWTMAIAAVAVIAFGVWDPRSTERTQTPPWTIGSTAHAAPAIPVPKAPALTKEAKDAVEKAVNYLRKSQGEDGTWEDAKLPNTMSGGPTAYAVLAMREAGVVADDPALKAPLKWLIEHKTNFTYVVALQTMALCQFKSEEAIAKAKENVEWLRKAAVEDAGTVSWGYTENGGRGDGSNSRFAVTALLAAHRAGIKSPDDFWKAIRNAYLKQQKANGGWGYIAPNSPPTYTMTLSGVLGLRAADEALGKSDEATEKAVKAGRKFAAAKFELKPNPHFYYGLELLAKSFGPQETGAMGEGEKAVNWYQEGLKSLIACQKDDGAFRPDGDMIVIPAAVSTSMAIRFLLSPPRQK